MRRDNFKVSSILIQFNTSPDKSLYPSLISRAPTIAKLHPKCTASFSRSIVNCVNGSCITAESSSRHAIRVHTEQRIEVLNRSRSTQAAN